MRDAAVGIVRELQAAGHTAYFAGGCVRDMLLGREPKDFDVATDARPEQLLSLYPEASLVGARFAVLIVKRGPYPFEVATFRRDSSYSDGRRPDAITYADAPADALRRDFTVNAMFYDPVTGEVHDFVSGRADLDRRLIRCIGNPDARFTEDYLRMLRAVRFAAVLGFAIEDGTFASLRANASRISTTAPERVRDELVRMLLESGPAGAAFRLLDSSGLLAAVLPEVACLRNQEQPPEFHPEGDVLEHTLRMLDMLPRGSDPRLGFAALLHDVGKPAVAFQGDDRLRFHRHAEAGAEIARNRLEQLRLPRSFIDEVVGMVAGHMRFADVRHMRQATLRRLVGTPTFAAELELHRLDCMASHGHLENHRFLLDFVERLKTEPALPPPFLTGKDVLAAGGKEGPDVGALLSRAYELQLEGALSNRPAALDWLHKEVGPARPR
ncbi:MAG: CCA tRNA nucleotidyltransferase [Lentisphaerae bacterium]|nr:CCA tRNA nucleotidyltransferase [Lentisphaerota bacterium]